MRTNGTNQNSRASRTGSESVETDSEPVVDADGSPHSSSAVYPPTVGNALVGPVGLPLRTLLAAFPCGAWVCGLAFDIASKSANEVVWGRAAMWLLIIGVVGQIVAL